MEWGFFPECIKTRTEVDRFRRGYKDDKGIFHPSIITLNRLLDAIQLNSVRLRNFNYIIEKTRA